MPDHILAIDQGTTSSRAIVFDRRLADRRRRAAGIPPAFPEARLGRARPGGHLALGASPPAARRSARRAPAGRHRRHRHHQPARDRGRSGTARPASRSTAPSSGRTGAPPSSARRCARTGDEPAVTAATGLLLDPYFSATKVGWLLDNVKGARERGRARRTVLRHDRLVPDLAADRRQGARHGRHQCRAHAAVQHPRGALGRRAAAPSSACRARCCPR